jgi:hypothetical protein
MSASIACSTVNDLFERETNRFSVDVHERYSVDGPWGRLVRVGKFPKGMGTTLSEITIERVLSGSVEADWTNVGISNGTSSNGCDPAPANLNFGQTVRTWNLQSKAYQTPCICLDDLKTSFQIESQIAKTVQQLTQLTKTVLDNRRRAEYLRLVPKIQAGFSTEYNNLNGVGGVPVPTLKLSQDQLDTIRVQLIRDGAGHNALGKENGVPVLGLITSPETSRSLLRDNSELRNDIRYATPSELIAPLGVERSFGGFYHMIDLEVPRFTYSTAGGGTYTQVYPFIQRDAGLSTNRWEANPAYNTAPLEAAYIFHPDVYEEAVQQVGPNIAGAAFDDYPYYYSGQFFWLNIRDAVSNPLGKIGRWMAIFQSGSRPIAPYLGRVIIHKRCPNDLSFATCTNS